MVSHPDFLRSPESTLLPDPRSNCFVTFDKRGMRPVCLQDRYDSVSAFQLHGGVPKEIVVHFETAKNLNLYAWYVYRFHAAAKSHAYACLELALRIRFKNELYESLEKARRTKHQRKTQNRGAASSPFVPMSKADFRPTLAPLLRFAKTSGALKNEAFSVWQNRTRLRANSRRIIEAIEEMNRLGVDTMSVDDRDVEPNSADKDHDYVGTIVESTPELRNHYAHGTTAIDNQSLSALRLVSDIVNQVFAKP